MQELVIDRIEEKKPRSGSGNPFFVVYGQNGEEMTTFDQGIKDFGKGTRLNVEPKVDGRHVNIARWELIEEVPAAGGKTGPAGKRDTEAIRYEYQLKARLQAIELASMEGQTAFNGIIELVKAGKVELSDLKAVEALKWAAEAFESAAVRIAAARIAATSDAKQTESPVETSNKPQFEHIGALLTWCANLEPPITSADFLEIVGVKEEELPKVNIEEAYHLVKDHLAAKDNPERLFD